MSDKEEKTVGELIQRLRKAFKLIPYETSSLDYLPGYHRPKKILLTDAEKIAEEMWSEFPLCEACIYYSGASDYFKATCNMDADDMLQCPKNQWKNKWRGQ